MFLNACHPVVHIWYKFPKIKRMSLIMGRNYVHIWMHGYTGMHVTWRPEKNLGVTFFTFSRYHLHYKINKKSLMAGNLPHRQDCIARMPAASVFTRIITDVICLKAETVQPRMGAFRSLESLWDAHQSPVTATQSLRPCGQRMSL